MGTTATKTISIDTQELIIQLNKVLADEWLAYYQYWVGAKVVTGALRKVVEAELLEHAKEEYVHADMLASRILQLGGAPVLEPKVWYDVSNCGYASPTDPSVTAILKQNIKGEQCAIGVYNKLLKTVEGKDPITYHLFLEILGDEIEHEDDLENILADIGK